MTRARPYRLFEVVGLEIEYAVVDEALRPVPAVAETLAAIHGRPTSETDQRAVGYSNELVAHVFEIKTLRPARRLDAAERNLYAGVRRTAAVLERHGRRLLPTGMHPLLRPEDTALWPRAGRRIYAAYDRIFGTQGHGWRNVQASHVNLPFGTEREAVLLHNATACLLPYLPAIAASSPIVQGRLAPELDRRLVYYRANQRRIPIITGGIVPEFVTSFADYRRRILRPIYRALDAVPDGAVLKHEWVNSRGAIMRFMRRAIEIRVLDTQECVKADVAIAAFVRGALRWMVAELSAGRMALPPHAVLVEDFGRVVRYGRHARVAAPHFSSGASTTARDVLAGLADRARDALHPAERAYVRIVADRLDRGSLAERIVAAVRRHARRGRPSCRAIAGVYEDLAKCLVNNELFAT